MLKNISNLFKKYSKNFNLRIDFKFLITIVSLLFVVYSIFDNADKLSYQNINSVAMLFLGMGTILTCLSIFINALAWRELVISLGVDLRKIKLIPLYITSNILKYLPGGIWHFVERLRVLNNAMPKSVAISSVLLEPLLMLVAASFCIPFGFDQVPIYFLCLFPSLIFIPSLRVFITTRLARIKASTFEKIDPKLSFADPLGTEKRISYPFKALFIEILFILVRFGGFFFCLKAFSIEESISLGKWISTFSIAWLVGLIVPGAPGGVGVFEAASLIIASEEVPKAAFLASLLCYRLVSTISDLFSNILVFLIKKIKYSSKY